MDNSTTLKQKNGEKLVKDISRKWTGLTEEEQVELINWFAKLPNATQREFTKLHINARNTMQKEFALTKAPVNYETEYFWSLFLIALAKMRSLNSLEFKKSRNSAPSHDELEKIDVIRLQRIRAEKRRTFKNKATLYNRLKFELRINVQNLLDQGASWAEITIYLKKYHKCSDKLDFEYLRKTWKRVQADLATMEKIAVTDTAEK